MVFIAVVCRTQHYDDTVLDVIYYKNLKINNVKNDFWDPLVLFCLKNAQTDICYWQTRSAWNDTVIVYLRKNISYYTSKEYSK